MAARAITLHLPVPLFEQIERRAQDAHRSIEAELLEVVSTAVPAAKKLSPGLDAELSALELLDDSALWEAAETRLPQPDAERMEELHRKQRLTGLSEAEFQELSRLEQQSERVILVRSHAAFLLEQRGHDIRSYLRRLTSGE
jgi:hypothetical protein